MKSYSFSYIHKKSILIISFQVLAELKAKREKDLSKKTIFEIDEDEFTVTKNEISLPGEDLL